MGIIRIGLFDGAEQMFDALRPEPRAKALSLVQQLANKTHQEIAPLLDSTTFENVFQHERRIKEGGLRVVYGWGAKGTLWVLGAYVKRNDKEGERILKAVFAGLGLRAKHVALDDAEE